MSTYSVAGKNPRPFEAVFILRIGISNIHIAIARINSHVKQNGTYTCIKSSFSGNVLWWIGYCVDDEHILIG